MNPLSLALIATLTAAPLAVWADANPDFDDDAKPILRMQPGLLQYVEHTFDVKDVGTAKFPGDDERRPAPPYIFRARPLGSHGPYNLRLLIQPGSAGHILGVVDMNKVHLNGPSVASRAPAPPQAPQPAQAPTNPNVQVPELSNGPVEQQQAPAAPQTPSTPAQPSEPTADTPSGPIMDSNGQGSSSNQPSLAPPPDPAPSAQ